MTETKKDVIRPTDAEGIRLAKTLLRSARYGALASLDPQNGAPMATRVAVATDGDGAPIILISALSAHTGALVADARCSLLLGEPGKGDPLAHARMTIACTATRLERGTPDQARAERRYLNRHPKAKLYAGFADFSYFRLDPTQASLNGGFAKAYSLTSADVLTDSPAMAALSDAEQSAVEHMNSDHSDAIAVYAKAYANAPAGNWIITGLDADGMDLTSGDNAARVFFPQTLMQASELRSVLVSLAKSGREQTSPATVSN